MKTATSNAITKRRIILIYMGLAVAFLMIAVRVVHVNTAMATKLKDYRERQSLRRINLHARRGSILDANGEVLAMDVPCQSIYAVPDEIGNKERVAGMLSQVLEHVEKDDLLKEFDRDIPFVWVKRKADDADVSAVKSLELKGVGFLDATRRVYPNDSLAANIVGFYGLDRGIEGLESTFEDSLRGEDGYVYLKKDAIGRNVPNSESKRINSINGNDLVLTIDRAIQYTAEKELAASVAEHNAEGGAVIVMDPRTGRIYAMASFPTFNPSFYEEFPKSSYRNNALSYVYEPGSIMKPVIAAAAMETGAFGEHSPTIFCPGVLRVDGFNITESHHESHGSIDLATCIKKSSNICFAKVGMTIGPDVIKKYLKEFGFGSRYDVGLNGSEPGLLPAEANWVRNSTIATVSYGHGISVTPLQMAVAFSALANGGWMIKPMLVEREETSQHKIVKEFKPQRVRRVISEETSAALRRMLAAVVADGTGKQAQIPNYSVAGKTGTAMVAVGGSYRAERRYNSSFAGFAPAEDPQFVVIAMLQNPKPYYYAGLTAAPLFQRVMMQTLLYKKIPPAASSSLSWTGDENGSEVTP